MWGQRKVHLRLSLVLPSVLNPFVGHYWFLIFSSLFLWRNFPSINVLSNNCPVGDFCGVYLCFSRSILPICPTEWLPSLTVWNSRFCWRVCQARACLCAHRILAFFSSCLLLCSTASMWFPLYITCSLHPYASLIGLSSWFSYLL